MVPEHILCQKDARQDKSDIRLNLNLPEYSELPAGIAELKEKIGRDISEGQLILGDCREICGCIASRGEKVDLVYIDPPFATGSSFGGKVWLRGQGKQNQGLTLTHYDDKIKKEDYLKWMAENLRAIRTVMSESGSIYVHLDWHICHYVKVLMDEIFGSKNFINEIVWTYKSGGASKNAFAKKHDCIYLYAKNKGRHVFNPIKEKSYNRDLKPYRFKGIEEYQDQNGWYTLVNMRDVWDINMVGRTSSERVSYATQKPVALLSRIIEASSDPGMTIADFFAGSGVTAAAALKAGRKFIVGDISPFSTQVIRQRLKDSGANFEVLSIKSEKNSDYGSKVSVSIKTEKKNEKWYVAIKAYENSEINEMIKKYNESKKDQLKISLNGIEMIEWISADCERESGFWHSSEEISINKEGHIIENGIEVNIPWNGIITTRRKPYRIKTRDIIGRETEITVEK